VLPEDERPVDADEPDPLAEADDGTAPLITNTGSDTPDDDADAATG
jgi:hypothetical protein